MNQSSYEIVRKVQEMLAGASAADGRLTKEELARCLGLLEALLMPYTIKDEALPREQDNWLVRIGKHILP